MYARATVLQTIKETGARIGEVTRIRWDDLDVNRSVISINYPEKGSLPKQIKVSEKLISMLNNLPRRRKTIFAKKTQISHQYYKQRKRLAFKLKNLDYVKLDFTAFDTGMLQCYTIKQKIYYVSNKD